MLEAFELRVYKVIVKISSFECLTNIEVTTRMKKENEIIIAIKRQTLQYLGHIMISDRNLLIQVIMQGRSKEDVSEKGGIHG